MDRTKPTGAAKHKHFRGKFTIKKGNLGQEIRDMFGTQGGLDRIL